MPPAFVSAARFELGSLLVKPGASCRQRTLLSTAATIRQSLLDMATTATETKHFIKNSPHPDLVGILHRHSPSTPIQPLQPLILILHGILAHKNQSYHPLLAKRLGEEKGWDSFRYDLRGQGGESEGNWGMANFGEDADDLERVVEEVESWGYKVKGSKSVCVGFLKVSMRGWELMLTFSRSSYRTFSR